MFRILVALVLLTLSLISIPTVTKARYASIVIEARSGRILHSINAKTKNYPASLTKIMTLYLTFDALKKGKLRPNHPLKVSRVAASRSPSKLGLKAGQRISVENAIKALIVKSANDVATVLAEKIGGTERRFAKLMTARAKTLGMKNTIFKNASGLPNRRQLSTAEDMAILARSLISKHPTMYHHFARRSFKYKGTLYQSHNRLMRYYNGMDGIKTGYIKASGFNLIASAKRKNKRIIAVVFGGKNPRSRDRHMARLMDKGFASLERLKKAARSGKTYSRLRTRLNHQKLGLPYKNKKVYRKGKYNRAIKNARSPSHRRILFESWAIQVGAYNRYGPAYIAITKAARAVPSLLQNRFHILQKRSKTQRGRYIYKARLLVASKSQARDSCKALKRRNIDCMVIWMGKK